jgi:beta-lactamase class A
MPAPATPPYAPVVSGDVSLQPVVDEIAGETPRVRWSIAVVDLAGGVLAAHRPGDRLSTASVGKVLLLAETARQIDAGSVDPAEVLPKNPDLAVADSGLWQFLAVDALPVSDLAVLIAATSDNYATNVLLERIGLDRVSALGHALGLAATSLNDRVRGMRRPSHPPGLSFGSAGELAGLMRRVARRDLISPGVSDQLDRWLATGVDLSMVASAFSLDPLAHVADDRGVLLRNKTGTDTGVRADIGYVRMPDIAVAYAVLANWDAGRDDELTAVMAGMRRIGGALASR